MFSGVLRVLAVSGWVEVLVMMVLLMMLVMMLMMMLVMMLMIGRFDRHRSICTRAAILLKRSFIFGYNFSCLRVLVSA